MSNGRSSLHIDKPVDPRRRSVVIKHSHFQNKYGKKHHTFDREKAPYPLSYDKKFTDLDIMDHVFLTQTKRSVSFVEFKDGPPSRSLDLGCGSGVWVLDAAKEWPHCEFVGFDLVNIQPAVSVLDNGLLNRVEWVHGNFLTTKLPFDDDEFDHVHIRAIARAVPENKWDYLFEEIFRVLAPGGVVEMIEEDMHFPTLPRWYTAPLRARERKLPSVQLPAGMPRTAPLSPPPTPPSTDEPHDHALLESLYNSVFESRFINREPTSLLPSYFATYFRHVLCSPVINFPMPPLPPAPTYSLASSRRLSTVTIPESAGTLRSRHHFHRHSHSAPSPFDAESITDDERSLTEQMTPPESTTECDSLGPRCSLNTTPPLTPYYSSPSDDTTLGDAAEMALVPISALANTTGPALALHLHRTCNSVLACQESMWEELKDYVRNHGEQLMDLGWDEKELTGYRLRQRFEKLIERYSGDMQARAALWQSLASSFSWMVPLREPLSKAEAIEEERLYQAMLEARELASEHELQPQCRTLRVFVGYKVVS